MARLGVLHAASRENLIKNSVHFRWRSKDWAERKPRAAWPNSNIEGMQGEAARVA